MRKVSGAGRVVVVVVGVVVVVEVAVMVEDGSVDSTSSDEVVVGATERVVVTVVAGEPLQAVMSARSASAVAVVRMGNRLSTATLDLGAGTPRRATRAGVVPLLSRTA